MQVGIIGLQSSGKTTLFNALTGQMASVGDFASGKEANKAMVKVPDPRLKRLAEIFEPDKITHAEVQYIDIAGMTGGASTEKSEAAYVAAIRLVDELAQVVRVFENDSVPHPEGSIDPVRDIDSANSELIFNDLIVADNNVNRLEKSMRVAKSDENKKRWELLRRSCEALEADTFLGDIDFTSDELKMLSGYGFLTLKPQLYILNIGESQIADCQLPEKLEEHLKPRKSSAVAICAKIAMEIAQLDEEDRDEFRSTLGIKSSALDTVITESYRLLGQISFLTGGEKEVRAWTIKKGASAQEAAGAIHSDFQRGFIKAEIVSYDELDKSGSWSDAKKGGKLRLEGKDYTVKDGDVILFRFNV
ncbi:MAG: redox-regulated ATPase YchF [candidate division Zixibacteria bacterium]|nr:redox-regulated ATPase YchF [candidate division Zixibacteria bacterium]